MPQRMPHFRPTSYVQGNILRQSKHPDYKVYSRYKSCKPLETRNIILLFSKIITMRKGVGLELVRYRPKYPPDDAPLITPYTTSIQYKNTLIYTQHNTIQHNTTQHNTTQYTIACHGKTMLPFWLHHFDLVSDSTLLKPSPFGNHLVCKIINKTRNLYHGKNYGCMQLPNNVRNRTEQNKMQYRAGQGRAEGRQGRELRAESSAGEAKQRKSCPSLYLAISHLTLTSAPV